MTQHLLIDTNVLIVANGRNTHADYECQLACIEILEQIVANDIVVLDSMSLILDEYSKYCNYKGDPGVGDFFFKHTCDNQLVESKCLIVPITPDPHRPDNFSEFPTHSGLVSFDPSDRKFVAASISSPSNSPIYNATDSDWSDARVALDDCDVPVVQLCPQHATR